MKVSSGSWELAAEGAKTRARYTVDIQISKPPLIPQSVIDKVTDELTRVQLPRTLEAFKARVERKRLSAVRARGPPGGATAWPAGHAARRRCKRRLAGHWPTWAHTGLARGARESNGIRAGESAVRAERHTDEPGAGVTGVPGTMSGRVWPMHRRFGSTCRMLSEVRSDRMLDAYVIEEIKRRERRRERDDRPVVQIPVPPPRRAARRPSRTATAATAASSSSTTTELRRRAGARRVATAGDGIPVDAGGPRRSDPGASRTVRQPARPTGAATTRRRHDRDHQRDGEGDPRLPRQPDRRGRGGPGQRRRGPRGRPVRRLHRRARGPRAARRRQDALPRQGRPEGGRQRHREDRPGRHRHGRLQPGRPRRPHDRAGRHAHQVEAGRQRHPGRLAGGGQGGRGGPPAPALPLRRRRQRPRPCRCRS